MRIVYIGARVVGHRCLAALLQARAQVVGLLTLDETKADVTTAFRSFDDLVDRYRLDARKFTRLNSPEPTKWVRSLQPDLGIVVGVSELIAAELLKVPRLGFIGMHPTLLPEGRGRAPIPWALIKGITRTGVSLFYCDPGADTGDLLAQSEVPIYYEDTSATLGSRTDDAAIKLLIENVPRLAAGTAPRWSQNEARATVWPRRRPDDGLIDWSRSRRELYNWVRALTHPYPGAFTTLDGRRLWIWAARESFDERTGRPGEVLDILPHGILVATGSGCLLLTRTQWDNADETDAARAGLVRGVRLGIHDGHACPSTLMKGKSAHPTTVAQ
jgi:methionyl-tRNA formyltransferase